MVTRYKDEDSFLLRRKTNDVDIPFGISFLLTKEGEVRRKNSQQID